LKKRSKKLLSIGVQSVADSTRQTGRSFLVRFFNKELLPYAFWICVRNTKSSAGCQFIDAINVPRAELYRRNTRIVTLPGARPNVSATDLLITPAVIS
jgi:hypothetical protein